ncbi:hypothetical protein MMC17_008162 [Xylographa soralifera]|nr:hypothetical protein [Xylographa soralifera]
MSEKAVESKKLFFETLYSLDDESTESEEENEVAVILGASTKGKFVSPITPEQKLAINSRQPTAMGRTMSSTVPSSHNSGATIMHAERRPQREFPSKLPRSRIINETKPVAPKNLRKRKRGQSLETLPESQQIFRGKIFYFLPNNDIAPARRFRILKAQERGALWVKEWQANITHVIVDNTLSYSDVLRYLRLSAMPPGVVLVNEHYPPDCMMYKFLVNFTQQRYQLEGQQLALKAGETPPSTESSLKSLQLKPEKSKAPPKTPSRTEGSDETAAIRQLEILARDQALRRVEELARLPQTDRPKDALDEVMEEAKAIEGLSLDSDEDDTGAGDVLDDANDSEGEAVKKMSTRLRGSKGSSTRKWQENFSCMQKHDGLNKQENPNARTIDILQKMADYYDRTRDQWRVTAYRKAIASLRRQDSRITTRSEALALPFIGARLANKIEEIVWTNRLRRLDNATADDPNDAALQLFLGVYGAGFAQARTWISQGYQTLESLSASAVLTSNQKIGVEHYDHFRSRVPRSEVEAHASFLRDYVAAVSSAIEVTVGGSYRRGAPDCGDIDFLLTSRTLPISSLRTIVLETIVPRLFLARYLKAALATTDPTRGTKWHGAACLPSSKEQVWRRVDFLLVPWEEMGAALIYFTGNDIFNRSMRLLASRKGMRLNQRGLFKDVLRGPGRVKVTDGELVEGKSEKKIFQILGVPWRPPEHRIC